MINLSLAKSFNQEAVVAFLHAVKHFPFMEEILWKSVLRLSYNPPLPKRKKKEERKKNYAHSLSF